MEKYLFYGDEDIELEIEALPITIKDPLDETVDKEVYH